MFNNIYFYVVFQKHRFLFLKHLFPYSMLYCFCLTTILNKKYYKYIMVSYNFSKILYLWWQNVLNKCNKHWKEKNNLNNTLSKAKIETATLLNRCLCYWTCLSICYIQYKNNSQQRQMVDISPKILKPTVPLFFMKVSYLSYQNISCDYNVYRADYYQHWYYIFIKPLTIRILFCTII